MKQAPFTGSLESIQQYVAPLKVFKRKELNELFVKYHKWCDNKSKCSQKQRVEGKEAFDLLVLHNLKLVIKIAHQYKYSGVDAEDLINEGVIGLMRGIEKFDVNNGARFSTYSALWIKQQIRRSLSNKSRTIRLPVHLAGKVGKIKDYISQYKSDNNNEMPSVEAIKENVKGISKKVLNDLVNGGVINTISLEVPVGKDSNNSLQDTLGEITEDEKIVAPDKSGELSDNINNLSLFLDKLKGREKFVIKRRFGLGGKSPETLDEIAESYGVSRERIRQIQITGMRRLRYAMGYRYGENFFIPK